MSEMRKTILLNRILWISVGILAVVAWISTRDRSPQPQSTQNKTKSIPPHSSTATRDYHVQDELNNFEFYFDDWEIPDLRNTDFSEGELLFGFKNNEELQAFLDAANQRNISVLSSNSKLALARVSVVGLDDLAKLASVLPEDMELQRNMPVYAPSPTLPVENGDMVSFGDKALAWLGVPENNTDWGNRQKIAILDTGVWTDHDAFQNANITQIDLLNPEQSIPGQYDGHGTAVASLIAGNSESVKGIAPAADLLSIRVLDGEGKGSTYTLAEGIVEAVDRGANIISLSLGSESANSVLRKAVDYAISNGVLIVASAGNEGAKQITWPAAYPDVIGVTSVDAGSRIADFSNTGEGVDLAAPGIGLQAAWIKGQEVNFSGTSASAPLVAGALAGILSSEHNLTASEALQLLTTYANDGYAAGKDAKVGHGVINLDRVMNRNQRGIYDIAVGGYHFSPLTSSASNKSFEITVQNRGTEWLSGSTLNLTVDNTRKSFRLGSMKPGEVLTAEWFLTPEQILNPEGTLIKATIQASGRPDSRPENNSWSTQIVLPDDRNL